MVDARLLPWQGLQVDPRLIASNHLMQLSTLELEQAIRHELDENPALEMVERITCPSCGAPLSVGLCTRCQGAAPAPSSEIGDAGHPIHQEEDSFDLLSGVAVPVALPEHLFTHLRLIVEPQDQEIALHLVGNLDEHGYLAAPVEEIAQRLQVTLSRVEAVLNELQHLDPAGVGARTVQECLLLQVERLLEQGVEAPAATRQIIEDYWEVLGHHQFDQIRAALQIPRADVEEVFLFVRANLHPYPAHHHYTDLGDGSASGRTNMPAFPSLLIQHSPTAPCGYEVEVVESQRFVLRLNPLYQQLKQNPGLTLSSGEAEHVTQFLERGRIFLSQLQRRHTFLRKLGMYLVEEQRDFLEQGVASLRPLTQKEVAKAVGVHVSTISRAVAGKYAQVPSREIVPLSRFFSAETRAQELVRQIIANEITPMSDERIAKLLKEEHGITLSRQMVANYREALRLPAARQRALLRRA